MERPHPLFRNHWKFFEPSSLHVPRMAEPPVYRRTVPVVPKVVPIPVCYVKSENTRLDSAIKIQRVFRGFLVRKSLKKVVAIEREVNEIERRLANEETVDLVRKDAKERIRFGEILMNLLFRLDSVKGVDSGIRNLRKAVIKKAIALQEKIDSIAAANGATNVIYETLEPVTAKCDSEAVDRESADECDGENADGVEAPKPGAILEESKACFVESNVDPEVPQESEEGKNCPGKDDTDLEAAASEDVSQTDSSNNPPNSDDGVAECGSVDERESGANEEDDSRIEEREGDGQSREILERMMMDNKRMMEMMAQLFEKNEKQSQLLFSLSQRVERLEKTLLCEILRKKKRNGTDSSEKSPKTKKSGK
uniref:BAG domain-containing protein n=1 Tax=Cucumis sativus TaxID=3659 RepID=A0A0A0KTW1_CUCSA